MPLMREWLACRDGLPAAKCEGYRRLWLALSEEEQRSLIPLTSDVPDFPHPVGRMVRTRHTAVSVDFSTSSTGLGDVVAKLLKNTRMDTHAIKLVKRITGDNDCQCRARQVWLNTHLPLPRFWRHSVGWWLRAWL